MADIGWLMRRLKAMSVPEVAWRISQKAIQKKEEKKYKDKLTAVIAAPFSAELAGLRIHPERLHLNAGNKQFCTGKALSLIGGYSYPDYKKRWSAGFQTPNEWPDTFSYSLEYKQRDDIGDARTNWELNRHFQFALLAKDYYATGDRSYLEEFQELFADWNEKNPFLHGISWTSVMEVAIRTSNWCFAYAFLAMSKDVPEPLLKQIQTGILNMTGYIAAHYSRYSSANNHLIVEAYAIGQSGILFDYQPWIDLSVSILTRELPLQNYPDGVNKELSIHYQSFYMEAVGLMLRLLVKNGMEVPATWMPMLKKMCQYMADCMGSHGEVIEFGDDDEGKILDLHGGEESHYKYVLGLLSCFLDTRYVDFTECSENLRWLFTQDELKQSGAKPLYPPSGSVCYRKGGNSILRSRDGRVLIGIDHAALGFGSIAAHGHADALSFQMFMDGEPVFVDPGTYIYHCDIESRNAFRKTENHNTVCIDGKDQSEMLGAFLWGKKAGCHLIKAETTGAQAIIEAEHDGYAPDCHKRKFELLDGHFLITDEIATEKNWSAAFLIAPQFADTITQAGSDFMVGERVSIHFESETEIRYMLDSVETSERYCMKTESKKIVVSGKGNARLQTCITWE